MYFKQIFYILPILFLLSGCSTLKVDVDYDSSYNFSNKTKYAVVHSLKESEDSLTNNRISKAIKKSLNASAYTEVSKENADLVFVFHVNVMNMSDLRTDYEVVGYGGYGYNPGWGYGGWGYGSTVVVPRSTTYRWQEGKLIIDAMNPKTQKIVWRGIVKDELSRGSSSQEEKTEYINKVVTKLMKEFPSNQKVSK